MRGAVVVLLLVGGCSGGPCSTVGAYRVAGVDAKFCNAYRSEVIAALEGALSTSCTSMSADGCRMQIDCELNNVAGRKAIVQGAVGFEEDGQSGQGSAKVNLYETTNSMLCTSEVSLTLARR